MTHGIGKVIDLLIQDGNFEEAYAILETQKNKRQQKALQNGSQLHLSNCAAHVNTSNQEKRRTTAEVQNLLELSFIKSYRPGSLLKSIEFYRFLERQDIEVNFFYPADKTHDVEGQPRWRATAARALANLVKQGTLRKESSQKYLVEAW
jgi:hypothetical protein